MKSRTLGAMLPVAFAVLLVAQGCAREEPSSAKQAADTPPAQTPAPAPAEPSAAPPADASGAAGSAAAPAGEAPATTTAAADTAAGAKIYRTYCQTCHGAKGAGDGLAAAGLNPKPASFATSSFKYDPSGNGTKGDIEDIKAIVHDGAAKHGGSPLMAPWPMLSPEQLQAVAAYVKSLGQA